MRRVSLAALYAIFASLFLAIAVPPAVNSQRSVPPTVINGRRIFTQSCAACHDTLGTAAKSGPGLKNYYRHQQRPSDANVRSIIQQGKGRMPPFSTLNKSQIAALIAYLKTL